MAALNFLGKEIPQSGATVELGTSVEAGDKKRAIKGSWFWGMHDFYVEYHTFFYVCYETDFTCHIQNPSSLLTFSVW